MFWANKNKHSTTFVVSKQKNHLPTEPPVILVIQFAAGSHKLLQRRDGGTYGRQEKALSARAGYQQAAEENLLSCLCCQRNYMKLYPKTVTDTAMLKLCQW